MDARSLADIYVNGGQFIILLGNRDPGGIWHRRTLTPPSADIWWKGGPIVLNSVSLVHNALSHNIITSTINQGYI